MSAGGKRYRLQEIKLSALVCRVLLEAKVVPRTGSVFLLGILISLINLCSPVLVAQNISLAAQSATLAPVVLISLYLGANAAVPFLETIKGYFVLRIREDIGKQRTLDLLGRTVNKDASAKSNYTFITESIGRQTDIIHGILDDVVGSAIPLLIALAAAAGLLATIDGALSAIVCVVIAASAVIYVSTNRPILRSVRLVVGKDVAVSRAVVESAEKIDDYIACHATSGLMSRIARLVDRKIALAMRNMGFFVRQAVMANAVKAIGNLAIVMVYVRNGSFTILSVAEIVAILVAMERISGPAETAVRALMKLWQDLAALSESEQLSEIKPRSIVEFDAGAHDVDRIEIERPEVLAGERKFVIPDAVTINRGDAIAVTGQSGVGKTTLMRALCGLTPVIGGRINFRCGDRLIDSAASAAALYVPQSTELVSAPLRENIRLFDPAITEEMVSNVIRRLRIDDHILAGRGAFAVGEKSRNVSGGQVRRIAIARALVRKPQCLVLDETFANLDMESVREILAVLKEECGIVIVVTHNADVAALLDRRWEIAPQ